MRMDAKRLIGAKPRRKIDFSPQFIDRLVVDGIAVAQQNFDFIRHARPEANFHGLFKRRTKLRTTATFRRLGDA